VSRILDNTNARDLTKEAFIGMATKLMGRVGKVIIKNPVKSLGVAAGAAFTVPDVLSGAAKMSQHTSQGSNMGLQAPKISM
jgi:hypothetical protein